MGEKHVFGLSQTLAFERWRFSLVALSLKPNVNWYGVVPPDPVILHFHLI